MPNKAKTNFYSMTLWSNEEGYDLPFAPFLYTNNINTTTSDPSFLADLESKSFPWSFPNKEANLH